MPAARRLGIGIVAYSPLGRGFLTGSVAVSSLGPGDFRRQDPRFSGAELARNESVLTGLGQLAAARSVTPAQLALAWLLARGELAPRHAWAGDRQSFAACQTARPPGRLAADRAGTPLAGRPPL